MGLRTFKKKTRKYGPSLYFYMKVIVFCNNIESYDKQNLTLMVSSYDIYETHLSLFHKLHIKELALRL